MTTHPEPLVRARPATGAETPATCRRLAKVADEHHWVHVTTYAHGTTLGSQGRPGRLIESVLLRLAHPSGRRAGAEWIDGRFSSAWAWVPGLILTKVKARELRAWIEGAPCQNER